MAKKTSESVKASELKHESLAHAVIAVMEEVKWIEKNSEVGSGNNKYKGIKDEDVKAAFNKAFIKHGLALFPVDIEDAIQIDRWEEENTWNGKTTMKMKQSVFTTVKTKYELVHADSKESKTIVGYGHGIDPQDKGAGKATTYALKYALLYQFLNPSGKIDDSDNTHSEEHEVPGNKATKTEPKKTTPSPTKAGGPSKKEEAISRILKAIDGSKTKKALGEVYDKIPESLKGEDKITRALAAKKAQLTPEKK